MTEMISEMIFLRKISIIAGSAFLYVECPFSETNNVKALHKHQS